MSATSYKPTNRAWMRRLLSGHPHQVIGGPEEPYMLRWYIIPRNPVLNVYVHKFLRSDDDRALHDHPWWFFSLILRGGYVEVGETADHRMTVLCRAAFGDWGRWRTHRTLAFRPAEYRHRVSLPVVRGVEQPCWTLIVTGPRRRSWGFWCPIRSHRGGRIVSERFIPWEQFGDAGCGETA